MILFFDPTLEETGLRCVVAVTRGQRKRRKKKKMGRKTDDKREGNVLYCSSFSYLDIEWEEREAKGKDNYFK